MITGIMDIVEKHLPEYEIVFHTPEECDGPFFNIPTGDLFLIEASEKKNLQLIYVLRKQGKKVILWLNHADEAQTRHLFNLQCDGYISNNMSCQELIIAIKTVLQGDSYIHQDLAAELFKDYCKMKANRVPRPANLLSEREWEVLELLTQGYSNIDMAKVLFITDKTVKNHVSSILKKLDVPDRTNAVLLALRHRWFVI